MHKAFAVLALLCPLAAANGAITEIRKDFFNETALLPATPILTAPGLDELPDLRGGGAAPTSAPTAILRWMDENSQFRSFTYPTVNGVRQRLQADPEPGRHDGND